jgi:MFS family permease
VSWFSGLRDFLLVWAGQVVSLVGSRLSTFALGIWVLRSTGSTTQFALIFVAMAVPALLVSPFAGALVDRWDRRRTMMVCESIGALTTLAMAAMLAAGRLAIWHVYVAVGIAALANAFFQPAWAASIPLLVGRERLSRVNGMVQTSTAIAQVLGPLLAGVLVSTLSMPGVLVIDGLTFLCGVAALLLARVPRPAAAAAETEEGLWGEAAFGWRYVRERPGLLGLLAIFGATNFLFGIASILITPLVLSFANEAALGAQMAIGGLGLVAGGVAMSVWGGPRRRIHGVLGFSLAAGALLAAHGLRPSFLLLALAGAAFFVTLPVINASNDSLWQSKVPPGLQGRCFAIQRVLSEAALPLGYALAGPLADRIIDPLLQPGGALAGTVGRYIGVGPGRGIGFFFIVLGAFMSLVAALAYGVRAVRDVEDELPDAPLEAAVGGALEVVA